MTANSKKYKVLLVEDESNVATLFLYNFKKIGFECQWAKNGKQGFEIAKSFLPDIIVSDIMMPVIDGYEFRKLLLTENNLKDIPFVFLTAKGTDANILYGYELGVDEYIIKTTSPKIISAKLKAILRSAESKKTKAINEISQAAENTGTIMVPDKLPAIKGFDIQQWHQTFENIPGGDFIDYIEINETISIIVLGDVMGKKWDAWYFAVAYAGYVRSAARFAISNAKNLSPSHILSSINKAVYDDERITEVFTTLSLVTINSKTNTISYSGAGDLPLIYFNSKQNEIGLIETSGLLLGFARNTDFEEKEILLATGDKIFLFTDGVIESTNANKTMFGIDRFKSTILNNSDSVIESIKKELDAFTENKYGDDISLIQISKI